MSALAFEFARPWWLLALLPVVFLVWRLWHAPRGEAACRHAIDAHLLPYLLSGSARTRAGIVACAVAMLLAVLALSGPSYGERQAYRPDRLRIFVVDLSPRMAPHLDRVKTKLLALLRDLPAGESALMVYAGEPYLLVPPTVDANTIAHFIPELASDIVPVPGNHPEHALRMANQALVRSGAAERDIVWVTAVADVTRLQISELRQVRVSVLQMGAEADPALMSVAQHTGGTFLLARSDDNEVRQLAGALAVHTGWRSTISALRGGADLGPWLLLLVLPFAAYAFGRGVLAIALLTLCLSAPDSANALPLPAPLADYRGLKLLQDGQSDAAAARFADPRWRAAASYRAGQFEQAAELLQGLRDPDSLYNRGNALARAGKLNEALAAYEASLQQRPDDADTRHNRDIVRQLLKSRGGNAKPPPPSGGSSTAPNEREAARMAEQWLRSVPDEPGVLLRRKLMIEHKRRLAGDAARTW